MNTNYSSPENDEKNNEKIEHFSKTVKHNIDNLVKEIEEEMKDYREKFLDEETKKLDNEINEYYNKNITDIDSNTKIKLSRIKVEKKHEYLKTRDELQNELFVDLEQKLLDFIKSPEYDSLLLRSCERCVNVFSSNSQLIINISENDSDKIQLIEQFLKDKLNFKIETDKNIKFGGLYYYDATNNVVLNDTIDERLSQEKLHFNQ
jgi:ATP synthase (E/31 kDa) subunit.